MENTREIVLDSLLELEREAGFSNVLVRQVLQKYDYLPAREKAFIKRVTEGTLERRIELDHILNQFSGVPVPKMRKRSCIRIRTRTGSGASASVIPCRSFW